jgi:cell surface protein SprA
MKVFGGVNLIFLLIFLMPAASGLRGQGFISFDLFPEEFETTISLTAPCWKLASIPQKQPELFPEAAVAEGCTAGYNRAWLSWFIIDPLFYTNARPPNVTLGQLSEHQVRRVFSYELLSDKFNQNRELFYPDIFNLAYYPSRRGPYNYDANNQPLYAAGVTSEGHLLTPESRWGGIMGKIPAPELFTKRDIRYIEFWLMDPFMNGQESGGTLYFNLGDISEDITPDSLPFNESALPTPGCSIDVTWTAWGRVPTVAAGQNVFDCWWDRENPQMQDVGYDGLADEAEVIFFDEYLQHLAQLHGDTSQAYLQAIADPSSDNYHHYRGDDYDWDINYESILQKYNRYNGFEGNTHDLQTSYSTRATNEPDNEDINNDEVSSRAENYFQYKIPLHPDQMTAGQNFISEARHVQGLPLPNQSIGEVYWYRFRIPLTDYEKVVGDIQDFSAIKFVRLFLKDFQEPVVLRFGTLDFVEINQNPENLKVNIAPNPAKNLVRILFPKAIYQMFWIDIYDHVGRLVYHKKYFPSVYLEVDIDSSTFDPGLYIVQLSNSRYEYITKLIIAK